MSKLKNPSPLVFCCGVSAHWRLRTTGTLWSHFLFVSERSRHQAPSTESVPHPPPSLSRPSEILVSLSLIFYVNIDFRQPGVIVFLKENGDFRANEREKNFPAESPVISAAETQIMDMMDTHSLSRGRVQRKTASVCRSLRFGEVPIVYQLPARGPGRAGSHAESCSRQVFVMQSQSRIPAAELSWILLAAGFLGPEESEAVWGLIGWFQLDGV